MTGPAAEWDRIKQWFHAALEMPPAERDSFLQRGLGDRDDLVAEIQTLLAAHDAGERTTRFERSHIERPHIDNR